MQKGKIFAFVGMVLVGIGLLVATQTKAQTTVVSAPETHRNCLPTKDNTNSNGYTESYTRSNNCHSAKVFYNYGDFFLNSDNLKVRCPAGAATQTHNFLGGWHYSMSPNISGAYDGPAHHFCVDASGNQVEAELVDVSPPIISAQSVGNLTQTTATVTWTTDEISNSQVEYGTTTPNLASATPIDPTMATSHSVNLTDLTAGKTYYYNAKSQDTAGNLTYSAGTFTTSAATNYSFQWTLFTPAGSVQTTAGNKSSTVIKLQNTGNTENTYTVSCTPATGTFMTPDAFTGTTLIAASSEKQFTYSISVGSMTPGTLTVTCKANRSGAATADEKTVTDTVTLIAPVVGSTTSPVPPPTPPTSPESCANGTRCLRGSWCQNGSRCFYPDSQITCVEWPAATASTPMNPVSCPAGTSLCDPSDANCVAPGQVVPYSSGKWCSQSQQYYSSDGINMTCVNWNQTPPAGYSVCRPGDASCIAENSYGPSTGNCMNAMKCYQKTTDTDSRNDVYCAKMSMTTTSVPADSATCPSGYSFCSPTDTNCKSKGDAWTDSNTAYNCMNSQKCVSPSGGGSCVGWSESCPAGSKYCSATDTNCIEPNEYKTISTIAGSMSSYWCGGSGGGMVFYSSTQAYCEKKAGASTSTPMSMMWTAEEIKAVLVKLGISWGLCSPGNTLCIEPGKTGPSDGWCGWMPPNSSGGAWSSPRPGSTRTCPSLDGTTPITPPPPLPPPPPEKNWVKHNWVFSDGTSESFILNRIDRDYLDFIASLDAECAKISKNKFSWKSGAGDDSKGNWKNFGIPDCSGTGTPTLPPPPGPWPEPRECNPGEVSNSNNMCTWPMYRWIYADKQFEKCSRYSDPRIMGAVGASTTASSVTTPMRPGTSCQSMNYELELKWKTMKYLAHPPEKEGEYWPQWDASFDRLQYNQKTDQLEACSAKEMPYMTGPMTADTWISPCQPIPPQDKEWMLEMYRSQYKMFLLYSDRWEKPLPPPPPPVPEQCRPYLNGVRQGLNGDKQFWKDVNRKLADVKSTYDDAAKVSDLLSKAKALIVTIDRAAKRGICAKETLEQIRTDLETLHTDIFSELSGYLTDMEEIGDLVQCRNRVEGLAKEVNQMMVDADDDETQAAIKDLAALIEEKIQGFEETGDELGFDAGFDCESFVDEIDSQLNPFRIQLNKDTGRVSQDALKKLGAQVETLVNDLAEKGKKMDELIVQVAQLQKQVETFSKVASEVSDKLVVSYKALADMGDRFKEDRQQILAEKNKLTSLVEEALAVMHESSCIRPAERDQMARELGDVATINWVPGRGEQLEKRLQLIISSCRAKDFTREDMASFFASLSEAERANLAESHRLGFTPFADVPTHVWYYGGMVNAYENGYMTKGMPGESALAQDALLMVLRAVGASDKDVKGDCTLNASGVRNVSPYAVCAVNYAHAKGLPLQGDMTRPIERIRIAEWITLLKPNLPKRADDAVDFDSFADIRSLGNDTRFVAYMYANGVMVGRVSPDGKTRYFDPHASLTRAALAVILGQLRAVAGDSGNQPG